LNTLPGAQTPADRLHVLLVLGRVSNLPTVWSDCLAAWLLAGAGSIGGLLVVCVAATLSYTGGMFLNDAVDVDFDRQYRVERPIPAGKINRLTVWLLAAAGLLLGWLLMVALGKSAAVYGFGLLTTIVVYDLVHKRMQWAVLVMAACRFLLYLVAAAAGSGGVNLAVATRAVALASYITGLSCLARGESTRSLTRTWPIGLLFVPLLVSLIAAGPRGTATWLPAPASLLWLLWCLRRGLFSDQRDFRPGIAGLLAGIVLVDWLAAGGQGVGLGPVFCSLFVLALILQRVAPAT
jgi:4-hydroxybenzoate polyprenyltransferase